VSPSSAATKAEEDLASVGAERPTTGEIFGLFDLRDFTVPWEALLGRQGEGRTRIDGYAGGS
jgi:hypothetical protein